MKKLMAAISMFSFLAFAIGLVALFTDKWMTVCVDADELLQVLLNNYKEISVPMETAHFLYKVYHKSEMCFSIGLFHSALDLGSSTFTIPMKATEISVLISSGPMILGLIILGIALFFRNKSFVFNKKIRTWKDFNEFKIQTLFLWLGGFLVAGCMILYTATQYSHVRNIELFYSDFGTDLLGIFTEHSESVAAKQTWALLTKTNPHFGYSYILGWMSSILITISYNIAFVVLYKLGNRTSITYHSIVEEE